MMTGNLSNLNIFSYVFFFFIFVYLDKSFLHWCMEMAFFVIYNCAIVANQCHILSVAPLLGWTPPLLSGKSWIRHCNVFLSVNIQAKLHLFSKQNNFL